MRGVRGDSRYTSSVHGVLPRKIEEETHHQRRTKLLSGRVNAALDQEWRAHEERDVERRDEPEVGPVGALTLQ